MTGIIQTERSYLKVVSDPTQICQHPVNYSPTKQLYSFSKAQRFGSSKLNFNCKAEFYTINEKIFRTQRTCSLGKGDRYDFSKTNRNAPPPNSYFPKNQCIEAEKSKGFSFGLSRDSCPQLGIVPFLKSDAQKPGPGAYTPILPKSGKVPTFHIRLSNTKTKNENIGPGKYDVVSSFQPSKPILNSKFRSAKNTKFAPIREIHQNENKTGDDKNRRSAAPMFLFDKTYQINKNGIFFNSKYKNSMCRYFGKEDRQCFKQFNDYPGPGNYRQPSEFGFYESSRACKE